jgi:hypothetical protein
VFLCSLHDVHEMNAYRDSHVCLSVLFNSRGVCGAEPAESWMYLMGRSPPGLGWVTSRNFREAYGKLGCVRSAKFGKTELGAFRTQNVQ